MIILTDFEIHIWKHNAFEWLLSYIDKLHEMALIQFNYETTVSKMLDMDIIVQYWRTAKQKPHT